MRKEMLSELRGDEEEDVKFGIPVKDETESERNPGQVEGAKDYDGVDWSSMVSGTKRVLSMDVSHGRQC